MNDYLTWTISWGSGKYPLSALHPSHKEDCNAYYENSRTVWLEQVFQTTIV